MRYTNSDIPTLVAARRDFTANSVTGRWVTYPSSSGWLPSDWAKRYWADVDNSPVTGPSAGESRAYVVRSYGTPMAWYVPSVGWTFPAVKYSRTTSRHQSLIARGLCGEVIDTLPVAS